MKVKGKRILKNGAVAGYVYYNKDKKWKWRIINGPKKKRGGEKLKSKAQLIGELNSKINKFPIFYKIKNPTVGYGKSTSIKGKNTLDDWLNRLEKKAKLELQKKHVQKIPRLKTRYEEIQKLIKNIKAKKVRELKKYNNTIINRYNGKRQSLKNTLSNNARKIYNKEIKEIQSKEIRKNKIRQFNEKYQLNIVYSDLEKSIVLNRLKNLCTSPLNNMKIGYFKNSDFVLYGLTMWDNCEENPMIKILNFIEEYNNTYSNKNSTKNSSGKINIYLYLDYEYRSGFKMRYVSHLKQLNYKNSFKYMGE